MLQSLGNAEVYLLVFRGDDYVKIHQIEDRETLIGRSHSCALVLPDPSVSRAHAIIVRSETDVMIRDLTSQNGTRLESKLIKEAKLFTGTKIEIGPYDLRCVNNCSDALKATADSDTSTWTGDCVGTRRPDVQKLPLMQQKVYEQLINGLSEKEIAYHLGISINTVHSHTKLIYIAFAVTSRGELQAQAASRRGPK